MKHVTYTRIALVLLTLLLSLSGCSHSADPTATGVHPEAVLVRFYDGATFVRACGGSLIGSNVVLTAAHCTAQTTAAVVIAPAAGGQRATTSAFYTYDWVNDDPKMDPAMRNDLALLALRTPITVPRYAAIQQTPCASCSVEHVGRGLDARGSFVVQSKALRVAANAPPQRPLTQFVAAPPAIADGGAFYRTSTTGQPLIVGVMSGKGQTSGGAYVAPLSDAIVQTWVRAIYKRVQQPSASSSKAKTTSLHVLDDPPSDDGDQSSSSSSSSSSGSSGTDPIAPPADGDQSSSSSSSGSNDPPTDAPTPPAAAEPVTPTSSAGDNGSPPSGASSTSSSSGDAPDPGSNTPAPSADKPDANGTQRDPASDSPSDDTPKPDNTYEDGNAPQGVHSWPGSIPGVAPLKIAGNGDEVATVQPSGNAVTVASPGDKAFTDDPEVAADMVGLANIYGSHGMPGTLIGPVPEDSVRGFMQDDKPLIVTACFGGAPTEGGSAIRRMVNEYGTDDNAARTYGCTGYATSDFQCTGTWVNANGTAVPSDEQQRLNMTQQQCGVNSLRRGANGQVEAYWDQCKSGSPGSEQ